jgi:hypothetical protein
MPKMRRFADLLRIGNCSFGGPSNATTNVLELLDGHHLTGCTVAVGDDCVRRPMSSWFRYGSSALDSIHPYLSSFGFRD